MQNHNTTPREEHLNTLHAATGDAAGANSVQNQRNEATQREVSDVANGNCTTAHANHFDQFNEQTKHSSSQAEGQSSNPNAQEETMHSNGPTFWREDNVTRTHIPRSLSLTNALTASRREAVARSTRLPGSHADANATPPRSCVSTPDGVAHTWTTAARTWSFQDVAYDGGDAFVHVNEWFERFGSNPCSRTEIIYLHQYRYLQRQGSRENDPSAPSNQHSGSSSAPRNMQALLCLLSLVPFTTRAAKVDSFETQSVAGKLAGHN